MRTESAVWPSLGTLASARVASRQGMWAAWIVAATTASASLLGLGGLTAWGLVDAALCILVGYGIRRDSRVAAILGLTYFTLATVSRMAHMGAGGILTPVIFLLFLNGVRGTFAVHRRRGEAQASGVG